MKDQLRIMIYVTIALRRQYGWPRGWRVKCKHGKTTETGARIGGGIVQDGFPLEMCRNSVRDPDSAG